MSIQTYNKPIYYDDRTTDGSSAPSSLTTKNGVGMEFAVRIQTTRGKDVLSTRESQFTIVGNSSTAISGSNIATAIYDLLEAGSRMAANIARMSKGRISGFYAKLGKFRADEKCIDVPTGDNSNASILMTNNENDELGKDACERTDEYPVDKAGQRLFIPWVRDDVSRQDIMNTLKSWQYVSNGITFGLGQIRFKDENKVDMTAYPTDFVQSIKVKEYSRSTARLLQNNDSALGIQSDKVLSEAFNDFAEGEDDSTTYEPDDDGEDGD